MRKIYLTEEQYIEYVVAECVFNNALNEGNISSKLFHMLFYGCHNFKDYANRILHMAKTGTIIALSVYISLIKSIPEGSDSDKESLVQQVERVIDEKSTPKDNTVYANDFNISQEGLEHIKKYEKLSLTPYYATKYEKQIGKQTIGWGHVIKSSDPDWIKKADSITKEQANKLFEEDMQLYVIAYRRALTNLPKNLRDPNLYTQGFIDAGISIVYNSGASNFKSSPFFKTWMNCRIDPNTKKINVSDYNYAASMIKRSCITQNGKTVNGLVSRRAEESLMAQQ